jgi:hypothetical protein
MTFDIFESEEHINYTPERALWLAVIERAMLDYCLPTQSLSRKDVWDLTWFFFCEDQEQYNLSYICHQLFDYPDAAEKIRKRVVEMQKTFKGQECLKFQRYRITALCAFQR